MINIKWQEQQDKFFGLDYSTKRGDFYDYHFDIRYDCDMRNPEIVPNCGLTMTITKGRISLKTIFGNSVEDLTERALLYLQKESDKFHK